MWFIGLVCLSVCVCGVCVCVCGVWCVCVVLGTICILFCRRDEKCKQ